MNMERIAYNLYAQLVQFLDWAEHHGVLPMVIDDDKKWMTPYDFKSIQEDLFAEGNAFDSYAKGEYELTAGWAKFIEDRTPLVNEVGMRQVWIVLNNDGSAIICDTKAEMEVYRNLSSTQKIEGPHTLSERRIEEERAYTTGMRK